LVDASETAVMCLLAFALWERRFAFAAGIVAIGATSKETVAPLAAAFAFGWVLRDEEGGLTRAARVAVTLALVGIVVASGVRSVVEQRVVLPWGTVAEMARPLSVMHSLRGVLAPQWVYAFAALLPMGVWGLRGLPRQWIAAAGFASGTAVVLGIYNDAGGNLSRPVFNVTGPLLALATARVICGREPRHPTTKMVDFSE
jgi:hypothetical protein